MSSLCALYIPLFLTPAPMKHKGKLTHAQRNLRYADDTILMAESEELKSLLMKVKE